MTLLASIWLPSEDLPQRPSRPRKSLVRSFSRPSCCRLCIGSGSPSELFLESRESGSQDCSPSKPQESGILTLCPLWAQEARNPSPVLLQDPGVYNPSLLLLQTPESRFQFLPVSRPRNLASQQPSRSQDSRLPVSSFQSSQPSPPTS